MKSAKKAVRWAINSAENTEKPVLCVLLLPYTRGNPYCKFYKTVGDKMRTGTHILATFRANTLRTAPIRTIGDNTDKEYSSTGHIMRATRKAWN